VSAPSGERRGKEADHDAEAAQASTIAKNIWVGTKSGEFIAA